MERAALWTVVLCAVVLWCRAIRVSGIFSEVGKSVSVPLEETNYDWH